MQAHGPPFCRLPLLVLEEIGLAVATTDPIGLPKDIVALLLSCRHIYSQLSYKYNSYLYGRIFHAMFDTRAVRRRLGLEALYSKNLSKQLRTYCLTLKRIRMGELSAPTVCEDLWAAFFMLMENDSKNYVQLDWAGLRRFVDGFVRLRLWDDREDSFGWPAESTINALALYLMWYTTDCGKYYRSPRP